MTLAINRLPDKPPSEPPPSIENKIKNINHHAEAQWLEDATTSADIMLQHMDNLHATTLGPNIYIHHPFVKSQRTLLSMICTSVIKETNMTDDTDMDHNIVSHHQNQPQFILQFQNHSYKIILHFRI